MKGRKKTILNYMTMINLYYEAKSELFIAFYFIFFKHVIVCVVLFIKYSIQRMINNRGFTYLMCYLKFLFDGGRRGSGMARRWYSAE